MLKQDIHKAILELVEEVEQILTQRIDKFGYNTRAKKNTLKGSNLEKSIKVTPKEDGFALAIADYWEFVSRGWIRTSNYSGTFRQMINNLFQWVRRKGIKPRNGQTENQLVWAIANKIFNYGIHYRPFMVYDDEGDLTEMIPELKAYMEEWLDGLFQILISDLDKYFNNNG